MKNIEKENLKLKKQLKIQYNEFISIIDLATKMREVLLLCRNHPLPLELAKKIDGILSEAENFD